MYTWALLSAPERKCVVGKDRDSAVTRLKRALDEFVINGIESTINLHKKILRHEDFLQSRYDVNWLANSKILDQQQFSIHKS